jgi:hypothetical protein
MAKLTIEIDMDDPQETWDALYRRIESIADEPADGGASSASSANPTTYDLLLEPERAFGDINEFFALMASRRD